MAVSFQNQNITFQLKDKLKLKSWIKRIIESEKKQQGELNFVFTTDAELLKTNSIDVARENEKTVVSLDTLKRTTQSLIETLTEVKRIHDEGTQNRRTLNTELQTLETELKKNVTNTR